MKILVMSDSHGFKNNMLQAVELEAPDYILHLGDSVRDCADITAMYPQIPLRNVKGNCDRGYQGIEMDEFVLEDKRIFMTHGHLFGVKTGKTRIIEAAVNRGVDILLFGHTHIPFYSVKDNLTILNPGSIGSPSKPYATIHISNSEITCDLKTLP